MLADGNLDRAVLHRIEDNLAVNGTRPEFVEWNGRWLIATSDYGNVNNAIRLYDPEALKKASRSSDPGVLVHQIPCGPWVQNVHWQKQSGTLFPVQNQIRGLKWRLTPVPLKTSKDARALLPIDLSPADELEGFHMLNEEIGILFSSSRRNNVRFAVIGHSPEAPEKQPSARRY